MRRERDDLLARLEQSENRHEELSGSVSAATRPLLRQIESLQANLNETQTASERVERSLSERLQQASIQLAAAQERERTAAEQYMLVSDCREIAEILCIVSFAVCWFLRRFTQTNNLHLHTLLQTF